MRAAHQLDHDAEAGDLLLAAVVMVALLLIALSVAAPVVARELRRDKELESQHRAEQYVRAIQLYYRKNKSYPPSIKALENTNNVRYLRQRYVDPLTGKDDWGLIHVGENQTKVKGFFGEDLPGLGAGLGSAAGMSSTTGGSAFGNGSSNTSAFGNNPAGGPAGATGTSAFGQNGTSSGTTSGTTSSSTSGTTTGTGGISSQSATA